MAKKTKNYLDYIPSISPTHTWDIEENGTVTIHMEHRGIFAWIAQKLFKRPRISHIHLDEMGSFVFPLIDGSRTVGDIADLVGEHFGPDANPLYERLAKYMQILYNYGFIYYKNKS